MRTHYRPFRERKRRFVRSLMRGSLAMFVLAVLLQFCFTADHRIIDGRKTYAFSGYAVTAKTVLNRAGITLGLADSWASRGMPWHRNITVFRAGSLTVQYHGRILKTEARGESVAALLERLGLEPAPEDTVYPALDAQTCSGMIVTVDRSFRQNEIYTAQLAYGTEYCSASWLPEGAREVLIPGQSGTVLRNAEVTYANGQECSREILSEELLYAPVRELVAVGGISADAAQGLGDMPVIGENTIRLPTGELLTYTRTDYVRATAYTHTDEGCDTTTATGSRVRRGTVAVDPRYIPYGTRMFIMAADGSYVYGVAEAEDCGGDIKGDRMDLYLPSFEECMDFGRRTCILYFLG